MREIERELRQGILLGDGAMGTELLARGFSAERPLEELNRSRPEVVRAVHRAYRAAGAAVLRTNTFRAGRTEAPRELAREGARIAREEATGGAFVVGSVGPEGDLREVCEGLVEGGCEAVLLETFLDLRERDRAAALANRCGLLVIPGTNCRSLSETLVDVARGATAAFPNAGLPPYSVTPAAFADAVARLILEGARLVGGCCGTTPAHIRAAARRLGL